MNIDYLIPSMEDALRMNVIVGPSLMATGAGGVDDATFATIREQAKALESSFWPVPHDSKFFPGKILESVIEYCVIESLSTTAAYYSHIRLGELSLSESMIAVARSFVNQLIKQHSPHRVLELHLAVNFYDNARAIQYYKQLTKQDFVSGTLHRPWIRYDLQYELQHMLEQGTVELVHDGTEYVQLTEAGVKKLEMVTSFLERTGFLKKRASLMRFSRFSLLEDYDELVESIAPMRQFRRDLLQKTHIKPGMRVLELGCGTGSLTVDAGLYKLVEPYGSIVATDPSLGMLRRARKKADDLDISHVKFLPMAAEDLTFKANSFDVVIGVGFLHFTDIEQAIREVYRVLKPQGIFSTIHALRFTQSSPLFPDWFKPLLEASSKVGQGDSLPTPEAAPELIREKFDIIKRIDEDYKFNYSIPENVVRMVVEIGNMFEESMNQLPWQAQEEMLKELVDRGYKMLAKYNDQDVHPIHPIQLITAKRLD